MRKLQSPLGRCLHPQCWKLVLGSSHQSALSSVSKAAPSSFEEGQLAIQCPKELTSELFSVLAHALPRRWHLDGRQGAVRPHQDPHWRLLPLTREASVVFREFLDGKEDESKFVTPRLKDLFAEERIGLTNLPAREKSQECDKERLDSRRPDIEVQFTFAELFAGLGGFRLGLEALGGQCVFASEINKKARELYVQNFHDEPAGDIRVVQEVPQHDMLVAGFPCQPFSALGPQPGLADERGKLFEEILRVLQLRHPPFFLLENVPGLLHSNKGKDFEIIRGALESAGYQVYHGIVNARNLTAQQRKRLFLVGFHRVKENNPFNFPAMLDMGLLAEDVLDFHLADDLAHSISDRQLEQLRTRTRMSRSLAWPERKLETLISHYSISVGRGQSQLVPRLAPHNPRLFTPRECARLMGFPDTYQLPDVMERQQCKALYPLLGNAVCPPVVAALAAAMLNHAGPGRLPGSQVAQVLAVQAMGRW